MDEGINKNSLDAISKQLRKLQSIETNRVKNFEKSSDKLLDVVEETLRNLKGSNRIQSSTIKDLEEVIVNTESLNGKVDSEKLHNFLRGLTLNLNSLRGGFRNFTFTLASTISKENSNVMSVLNIFSVITDMLSSLEGLNTQANSLYIKGYSSLGKLETLNIKESSERLANVREAFSNFGYTNDEIDSALNTLVDSGGFIGSLDKKLELTALNSLNTIKSTADYLAFFSRSLGYELGESATIYSKLEYDLGQSHNQAVKLMEDLRVYKKDSKLNSQNFIDTVLSVADSTKSFGVKVEDSSRLLSFLSKSTNSAANALEIFSQAIAPVESDNLRLPLIQKLLKEDSESGNVFRETLLNSLEKRLEGTQANTQENLMLKDLINSVKSIPEGTVDIDQLSLLLNRNGAIPVDLALVLDGLVASSTTDRKNLRIYSDKFSKNYEVLSLLYGKNLKESLDTINSNLKTATNTLTDKTVNLEKEKGINTVSAFDSVKNTLENILLKNLGPSVLEITSKLKNLMVSLNTNKDFQLLFSPDLTLSLALNSLAKFFEKKIDPDKDPLLSILLDKAKQTFIDYNEVNKFETDANLRTVISNMDKDLRYLIDYNKGSSLSNSIGDKNGELNLKEIIENLKNAQNLDMDEFSKERFLNLDKSFEAFKYFQNSQHEILLNFINTNKSDYASQIYECIDNITKIQEKSSKNIEKIEKSLIETEVSLGS